MVKSEKVRPTTSVPDRTWQHVENKQSGTIQLTDNRPLFHSQSRLVQMARDAQKEALIRSCLRDGLGYLYTSIESNLEAIFQSAEGSVMISWSDDHIRSLPWRMEAFEILRHPQAYAGGSFAPLQPPMVFGIARPTVTYPVASRADITKTFIREDHFEHITEVCKSSGCIIVVREAGNLSLKRMGEGANPKPHTVLDKSVTAKRLEEMVGSLPEKEREARKTALLEAYGGFVGKWDKGKLQGLIVVNDPILKEELIEIIGKQKLKEAKVSLDPEARNEFLPLSLVDLVREKVSKKEMPTEKGSDESRAWQSYFYTGDYDLHEVYDNRNFQIPEATLEKRRLLNKLNAGLIPGHRPIDADPRKADLPLTPIHVPDRRAPFQHGDQAVYRMNQVLEGGSLKSPHIELVPAVAIADPGRLAWCVRGTWYTTEGLEAQKRLRAELGLTAPSTWDEDEQPDTAITQSHYRDKEHPDGKRTQRFI